MHVVQFMRSIQSIENLSHTVTQTKKNGACSSHSRPVLSAPLWWYHPWVCHQWLSSLPTSFSASFDRGLRRRSSRHPMAMASSRFLHPERCGLGSVLQNVWLLQRSAGSSGCDMVPLQVQNDTHPGFQWGCGALDPPCWKQSINAIAINTFRCSLPRRAHK